MADLNSDVPFEDESRRGGIFSCRSAIISQGKNSELKFRRLVVSRLEVRLLIERESKTAKMRNFNQNFGSRDGT